MLLLSHRLLTLKQLFEAQKPGGYRSNHRSLSKGDRFAQELDGRFAYVAEWVAMFDYLKSPEVKKAYRDVSRDMRRILESVESAYRNAGANSWKKGYDEWQTYYLAHIPDKVMGEMQDEVRDIREVHRKLLRYDNEQARELNKRKQRKEIEDARGKIKALTAFRGEINALSRKVDDIQLDYLKV
jgi:hypothetical protein